MPGIKPKGKVKIEWSPNFTYAIGLIVSDGCVSGDGRHISFVSKDIEQIHNFSRCLGLGNIKVGVTYGHNKSSAFRLQFGDIIFCNYLKSLGVTSAKSLTIGKVLIPECYFKDFLRGVFDGDGCFYSHWDKRWKSSFMFYISFASGSKAFVDWFRTEIYRNSGCTGHISVQKRKNNLLYQLRFARKESLRLISKMYYGGDIIYLKRKRLKINEALGIIGLPHI